jgi:hypothetical protein
MCRLSRRKRVQGEQALKTILAFVKIQHRIG